MQNVAIAILLFITGWECQSVYNSPRWHPENWKGRILATIIWGAVWLPTWILSTVTDIVSKSVDKIFPIR